MLRQLAAGELKVSQASCRGIVNCTGEWTMAFVILACSRFTVSCYTVVVAVHQSYRICLEQNARSQGEFSHDPAYFQIVLSNIRFRDVNVRLRVPPRGGALDLIMQQRGVLPECITFTA